MEKETEKIKQRFERPSIESCEFVVAACLQGSGSVNGHSMDKVVHVNFSISGRN